jgi:PAS domain S-box-containing protein
MAAWLVPAMISTLSATLMLAGLYAYLYRLKSDRYMGIWALSWAVYATRFVFSLIDATGGGVALASLAGQAAALVSGVLLLWGSLEFLERRLPRWWWPAAGAIAAWLAAGLLLDVPSMFGLEGDAAFTVVTLPNFVFLGLVYIWTGRAWLSADPPGRVGHRVTGWLFVVWGVHKLDFPFLRPVAWFAPWGYLLATLLTVGVALGIVVVYFRTALLELEESRGRYRALFNVGHVIVMAFDAVTGEIVEANHAASSFYGYPVSRLIGMNVADVETKEPDEIAKDLATARERREPDEFVHQHRTATGSVRTVDVHGAVQCIQGRDLVVAIIRDITEEVRTREALAETEERYKVLFETNRMAILQVDPVSLEIVEANPAAQAFYAGEDAPIVGSSFAEVTGDTREALREDIEETIAHERFVFAARHRRSDGSLRDVEVQVGPMSIKGRTLLSLLVVDVTERNRAFIDLKRYRDNLEKIVEARTAELEKTNAELAEASRAKSQFLAAMSHELRTPLNSIIGFTGILLQGLTGDLNSEQNRQLEMVNNAGRHLLELINAVLDLSKIEAGRVSLQPAELDMSELIRDVVESLRPLAEERGLELRTGPLGLCRLVSDETRLRQVLINLVGNAIKFTQEGSVTVDLARTEHDVSVVVRDTGPGIAPKDLPHVFEEFRQLGPGPGEAKPTGTGLGLPVALKLARLLGGDIRATSELDKGSEFTFVLPKDRPGSPEPDSRPDGCAVRTKAPAGSTVLVVDDDPSIHDLFRAFLREEGVRLLHAYDLDSSLRLLRRRRVDLVLLDLAFEEASGWSLLKRIRSDRSLAGIPVFIVSVIDEPEKAERYGADDYLVKPVDKSRLVAAVTRALGG